MMDIVFIKPSQFWWNADAENPSRVARNNNLESLNGIMFNRLFVSLGVRMDDVDISGNN